MPSLRPAKQIAQPRRRRVLNATYFASLLLLWGGTPWSAADALVGLLGFGRAPAPLSCGEGRFYRKDCLRALYRISSLLTSALNWKGMSVVGAMADRLLQPPN